MGTGKITLNLASSLDGFVATGDGGVSWLDEFNEQNDDSIDEHDLSLIESTSYTNGIVELRYEIDTE